MSVLMTRIHKPPISDRFISRKRLLDKLNREVDSPVTTVIAGAGYGKSVLISQWAEFSKTPNCWISLEEDCNDVQVFLSYVVAAIRKVYPESFPRLAQQISSGVLPVVESIADTFCNELFLLEGPIWIVFDDLHTIHNDEVYALLNHIIRYSSEKFKLIFVSRIEPPIDIIRNKAYDQICEIGMSDLRMDSSEIIDLAKCIYSKSISEEESKIIEESTEGWILAVNLYLKEYSTSIDNSHFRLLEDSKDDKSEILYNFFDQNLSKEESKILKLASLFDRCNTQLLKRLISLDNNPKQSSSDGLGNPDLKESGVFSYIIPLDSSQEWFRLHHLVGEILSKRFSDELPNQQLKRYYSEAARFFSENEYFEEAIRYSFYAENDSQALQIIERNWEKLLEKGDFLRLSRWINLVPENLSNQNPLILIIKAFLCDTFTDFDSMKSYLRDALIRMGESPEEHQYFGVFSSVHSCFSAYTNDLPTALKYAEKALNWLRTDSFLYDYALNFKVIATSMLKSPDHVKEFLNQEMYGSENKTNARLIRLHVIKLLYDWNRAHISDLKYSSKIVIEACQQEKVWWMYKIGNYYSAQYHYIQNNPQEAYEYVDQGIECLYNAGPVWNLQLHYTGVLAALANNDVTKADRYLGLAREFIEISQLDDFRGYLFAFEVELALRNNDLNSAWKINRRAFYEPHPATYYYYVPQFTQIKLFIHMGSEDFMSEARDLILKYKEITKNVVYASIQLQLLDALWHMKSGNSEEAAEALSEALKITPDGNYIRAYLDMGLPFKEIFAQLSAKQRQSTLVRNILHGFSYEAGSINTGNGLGLKPKEIKILKMVAKGLQNKEIADQLYLSEPTIRTYLHRIYQKLSVKNRLEAVSKLSENQLV